MSRVIRREEAWMFMRAAAKRMRRRMRNGAQVVCDECGLPATHACVEGPRCTIHKEVKVYAEPI